MKILFFFFNDTATTEIYTLSLHDALPISGAHGARRAREGAHGGVSAAQHPSAERAVTRRAREWALPPGAGRDRKSTRLNSSHANISYAVFCLKKKTAETRRPASRADPRTL